MGMEQFVDFCEDAIFEMQMAASLMAGDEEVKAVKAEISIPGEDEPRGIIAPLKENLALGVETVVNGIKMLHPANISVGLAKLKTMTPLEMGLGLLTLAFWILYGLGVCTLWVNQKVFGTMLTLMRGPQKEVSKASSDEEDAMPRSKRAKVEAASDEAELVPIHATQAPSVAFASAMGISDSLERISQEKKAKDDLAMQQDAAMKAAEDAKKKKAASTSSSAPSFDFGKYAKSMTSFLARNFFTMKFAALVIAFIINFMLLFYRVSQMEEESEEVEDDGMGGIGLDVEEDAGDGAADVGDEDAGADGEEGEGGEDEGGEEYIHVEEQFYYLEYIISILALIHALLSFCMLIAYYNLKIPLAIFKREKEVARKMEFDGIYISEQPEDDNLKGHWDKMVISAKSFPVNYWDKFVKKRVREKYSETFEFDALCEILGMEKSAIPAETSEETGLMATLKSIDWRYQVWKIGVTVTDNTFLYLLFYFIFSVLGNYNYFFFAAHLIDVAVGVPALRIILQAITYNGKELVLTVGLLSIVCYIYPVLAFNFFREFYVAEGEEGEDPNKMCHDVFTCFVFHMYQGVRAGGGIGDVIEPPDGADNEYVRIIFDFSFFLFITLILLAIIQGFIIDAFGALRDQLQGVEDELAGNCFICSISKDYLDGVPHGFDTHVQKEHNLANYLFFLMYLINKDESDYTGQETFVWNMYQERCWDFFPAGDCFRKQYESELGGGGG